MTSIEIRPASGDRHADVTHALTGGGDGRNCQCPWWILTNAQWKETDAQARGVLLGAQLRDDPPPGLVAYVDGEAAGWARVGPRPGQARLARTREFSSSPEPFDDSTVWAVTCFVVRRDYRGLSLTSRLLAEAVRHASRHGARVIEGYPIDPAARTSALSPAVLFRGALSTFLQAGFREIARPRPDRVIVSREAGIAERSTPRPGSHITRSSPRR